LVGFFLGQRGQFRGFHQARREEGERGALPFELAAESGQFGGLPFPAQHGGEGGGGPVCGVHDREDEAPGFAHFGGLKEVELEGHLLLAVESKSLTSKAGFPRLGGERGPGRA